MIMWILGILSDESLWVGELKLDSVKDRKNVKNKVCKAFNFPLAIGSGE